MVITYHHNQRDLDENVSNFIAITVRADGLAPNGARPSAGTVMTKFVTHMNMGPALVGLSFTRILDLCPILQLFLCQLIVI